MLANLRTVFDWIDAYEPSVFVVAALYVIALIALSAGFSALAGWLKGLDAPTAPQQRTQKMDGVARDLPGAPVATAVQSVVAQEYHGTTQLTLVQKKTHAH